MASLTETSDAINQTKQTQAIYVEFQKLYSWKESKWWLPGAGEMVKITDVSEGLNFQLKDINK